MRRARDRLIVALDVASVEEARALIAKLGDSVGVYKIGLELLFAGGFALAGELAREGHAVFIDAKLLDIEATVERATAAVVLTGARFLTVHAVDRKTLAAAVRGRGDSALKLLGVTVLTNLGAADLVQQGIDHAPAELVLHRAMLTKEAGFDGVIASGQEAAAIRGAAGAGFLIVAPGIRPKGLRGAGPGADRDAGRSHRGRRRLSRGRPADHPRARSAGGRARHRGGDRPRDPQLARYRVGLNRDSALAFCLTHDLLAKTGSHFSPIMLWLANRLANP
jgi:orotidine-5'-phosphate decarboxylase